LAIEKWVVDAVNEYNKKHNIETKPEWFNQDIKTTKAFDEDIEEINKLLEGI
jgi:biotin synthase-like enzyme